MNKKQERKRIFSSMAEFDQEFLPKSLKNGVLKESGNAQDVKVDLAEKTLERIRKELSQ